MSAPLILIVEDNARNAKLLRDVLEHGGYRTLEAGSGEDGVALARTEHPALVLMDIQLPGIDGLEALARLRSAPETAAVPVVAVTAFAMEEDRRRIAAARFDGHLEKPIDVRALRSRVASLLGREAPA